MRGHVTESLTVANYQADTFCISRSSASGYIRKQSFLAAEVEDAGDDDSKAKAQTMAEERVEARNNKDWGKADELRDSIAELGYSVQDTPQGPVLIPLKDA